MSNIKDAGAGLAISTQEASTSRARLAHASKPSEAMRWLSDPANAMRSFWERTLPAQTRPTAGWAALNCDERRQVKRLARLPGELKSERAGLLAALTGSNSMRPGPAAGTQPLDTLAHFLFVDRATRRASLEYCRTSPAYPIAARRVYTNLASVAHLAQPFPA